MLTGHDVPAAGGGDATKERMLAIALQSGIIGQNDHDTQLRVERNRQSSTILVHTLLFSLNYICVCMSSSPGL